MPIIGPGPDDPEYDNYDPNWQDQDTPFRRWLVTRLAAADSALPADFVTMYAPANRYNGLDEESVETIALLTGTDPNDVRAAHAADITDWISEQQLRDHPDLVSVDADLDRIRHRS
ncbi:hypothetical protein [Streptomyces cyaneofuscatus]|uniref:hypothetical protein n=1 Tax=Streptomyces cyaneofuscatus TaxID=66883 RepID=UPI00364D8115